MSKTKAESDRGQSIDDDSTEKAQMELRFAKKVGNTLANHLATQMGNPKLSGPQRERIISQVFKEGRQVEAKEAELAKTDQKMRDRERKFAVRQGWGKGSLVEAFSVETRKWYRGTVQQRHGTRLRVRFHHLGLAEWLPDTSKRLRRPVDMVSNAHTRLGQSIADGDSAHMKDTMSEDQIEFLHSGLQQEIQKQQKLHDLAHDVAHDAHQLDLSITKHLEPQHRVRKNSGGTAEYFIAPVKLTPKHSNSDLGESMSTSKAHHGLGESMSTSSSHHDLGESMSTSGTKAAFTRTKLANNDAAAVQAYHDHMQHIADQRAQTEVLKAQMADMEQSALQHEVKESARVTKLAKSSGRYKNLVSKALKHLRVKEKHQLHAVENEARAGVWSSYQSTLKLRQDQLQRQIKNVRGSLHDQEAFRDEVNDKAMRLAGQVRTLQHLESSSAVLTKKLHHLSNPKLNLK